MPRHPAPTNPRPPPPSRNRNPIVGKIASVDTDAKTFTVTLASGASQTIHITSRTRIRKDGQPATLADAAAGLKVSGTEREDDSGNWVANTVNIGEPKPNPPQPPPTPLPQPRINSRGILLLFPPPAFVGGHLAGLADLSARATGCGPLPAPFAVPRKSQNGRRAAWPWRGPARRWSFRLMPSSTWSGGVKGVCTWAATTSSTVGASNGTCPVSA